MQMRDNSQASNGRIVVPCMGRAKKLAVVDMAVVLWGGAFLFTLMGKRCPSGAFSR